jgi:hypothetical protein
MMEPVPDQLMAVPDSSDTVVLLDYMGGPNVLANLFPSVSTMPEADRAAETLT